MQMMTVRGCSNQAITVLYREENKKGRVKEEGKKKRKDVKAIQSDLPFGSLPVITPSC